MDLRTTSIALAKHALHMPQGLSQSIRKHANEAHSKTLFRAYKIHLLYRGMA